jgi:hypothetical protein
MVAVDGINRNGNGNGSGNSNGVNGGDTAGVGAVAPSVNLKLPKPEEIFSLNVHQRVRWIIAETRSLPKSQWNPEGEFAYAGHDQIIDMLRLLLAKYGVNIYQEPLEYKRDMSLGGVQHLTTVKYEYEVVNADSPDDSFIRHNWGEAIDDWDKGLNKCSTIAEKMFLLRLFKISTFDDPDAHSAEKPRSRGASQNGNDKARRDQTPPPPGKNECHDCRELITKANRAGKVWQSSEIIATSRKQFGKQLCVDCLLAAQAAAAGVTDEKNGSGPQSENAVPTPAAGSEKPGDSNSSDAAK